jgi:hypothetical protein
VPFVRFSRDRRGYEHVYLVDVRDHGRSRVIYWFRTPPGVKVGRSPFDSATQRSLEQQYPDVKFDWSQIVAARMPPPAPVENWREKRRAERAFKRARSEETVEVADVEHLPAEPMPFEGDTAEMDAAVDPAVDPVVDDAEPRDVSVLDLSAEGPEPAHGISAAPAPANAISGTRRKRRRRRRGPLPDRPRDAATPPSAPDGPLDPAEPPEKPSNEG